MDQKRHALTCLAVILLAAPLVSQSRRTLIVQTNAAGDNVHLIDPTTNTVVGEIGGIECPTARRSRPTVAASTSPTSPRTRSTSSIRAR